MSPNASLEIPKGSYINPFMIIEISSSPEKLTLSPPKRKKSSLTKTNFSMRFEEIPV